MKVAFHTPTIDVRGTCVALFDYANYNELLLNNTSIIITPSSSQKEGKNDEIAIQKFEKRFSKIFFYDNSSDSELLEKILEREKVDVLYCIKYGTDDGVKSKRVKTCVHCVFDMTQPHGDVYAGVSSALAKKFPKTSKNGELYVPHMIGIKVPSEKNENLRNILGIPDTGIVFGRYGGMDTFDFGEAHAAIRRVLNSNDNVYFLLVNTPRYFGIHPRVFYLNKVVTDEEKARIINTCDAHLECGTLGHSFGLAIGEFSVMGKPIIAYNGKVWNTSHLEILDDKGIYFNGEEELFQILNTFNPTFYVGKDMNCYKEYSPEKVMEKFKKVFLD